MTTAFDLSKFIPLFKEEGDERAAVVTMARISEGAERYEDMCQFMKHLVDLLAPEQKSLTTEERNLLSVAYKNVIGGRRASWRTLNSEGPDGVEEKNQEKHAQYTKTVVSELISTCEEVLDILKKLLKVHDSTNSSNAEEKVFYLKMAGDYYRYLAESVSSNPEYAKEAEYYYKQAHEAATKDDALVPTHPIRLGLALNFSVCHYEILNNREAACDLAKSAFDEAIAQLDKLEEEDYKDSTLIMQLLRDNLTLWSADADGGVEVEDISDDEN